MLQLRNQTPFPAMMMVVPDRDCVDTLVVLVKGTFALDGTTRPTEKQVPIATADVYYGEPNDSSLKYAGEMHLPKPTTDVILVGSAHSPGRVPVETLEVELRVAERGIVAKVYGDRTWKNGVLTLLPSSPTPFTEMPLIYENAYGGVHIADEAKGKVFFEPSNPVGRGFPGKRRVSQMKGEPLPNIEDPERPLRRPKSRVRPIGFGFVAPSWEPRRRYAGTYDQGWQKHRAPFLPEDFDPRFFNVAPPPLVFDRFLQGGEPLLLRNLSPAEPTLRLTIPAVRIKAAVQMDREMLHPPLNLDTVLIEPDEGRLTVSWRASTQCDKKVPRLKEVMISLEGDTRGD